MCGDHGIGSCFDAKLELPKAIAKGDDVCALRYIKSGSGQVEACVKPLREIFSEGSGIISLRASLRLSVSWVLSQVSLPLCYICAISTEERSEPSAWDRRLVRWEFSHPVSIMFSGNHVDGYQGNACWSRRSLYLYYMHVMVQCQTELLLKRKSARGIPADFL